MFGDITTEKYNFETRKLGTVSEVGSSHRVFTTEFVEQGIPFYRGTEIGELANGKKPKDPFFISEEHYNRLTKEDTKPKIGDLLMPSICNKGQVWMVDTEEPFYYKDGRVLSISPNRKIFNSKYLQYFLREKTILEYPKLGSGSTFAEFKIFLLRDIDILTPPIELQNDFAAFVQQIDKSKFEIANTHDILYNKLCYLYKRNVFHGEL
ncbi:MAG: restriction endonuclease subunit S [Spirochaetaceae bacterium]|nr:restriction endonuclease subunit S [Spirochaetaceae bacterium]